MTGRHSASVVLTCYERRVSKRGRTLSWSGTEYLPCDAPRSNLGLARSLTLGFCWGGGRALEVWCIVYDVVNEECWSG